MLALATIASAVVPLVQLNSSGSADVRGPLVHFAPPAVKGGESFEAFDKASTIRWTTRTEFGYRGKWPVFDEEARFQIYPGIYPGLTLAEVRARLGGSDVASFSYPSYELTVDSKEYDVTYFAYGALSVVTKDNVVKAVLGSVLVDDGQESFSPHMLIDYPKEELGLPRKTHGGAEFFPCDQADIYVYPKIAYPDNIAQVVVAAKGFDPVKEGFKFKEVEWTEWAIRSKRASSARPIPDRR